MNEPEDDESEETKTALDPRGEGDAGLAADMIGDDEDPPDARVFDFVPVKPKQG